MPGGFPAPIPTLNQSASSAELVRMQISTIWNIRQMMVSYVNQASKQMKKQYLVRKDFLTSILKIVGMIDPGHYQLCLITMPKI